MHGVREDLGRRPHLDDLPALQDDDAVRDVVAEREVVRDEQDAEPALLEVAEDVEDVDPGRRVEHADDLVGDEELDVEDQRARDEQPLELASAELMRVLAEDVRRLEPDVLEAPLSPRAPLGAGQFRKVGVANHLEHAVDLEDRVVRAERILEDTLDTAVVTA